MIHFFIVFIILLMKMANANIVSNSNYYIGFGASISSNKYSTDGSVANTNTIQPIINATNGFLYNGTKEELMEKAQDLESNKRISTQASVLANNGTQTFTDVCLTPDGAITFYYPGDPFGNPVVPVTCQNNTTAVQFQYEYFHYTVGLEYLKYIPIANQLEIPKQLVTKFGEIVLEAVYGTSTPLPGIFNSIDMTANDVIINDAFTSENITKIFEALIQEGLIIFNEETGEVSVVETITKNKQDTALALNINAGFLNKYKKIYYGGEIGLDIGNSKIGDAQNEGLLVKFDYTLYTTIKVGISPMPYQLTYVFAGIGFRDYKLTTKTSDIKKFTNNYILGAGMEFAINKKANIYTELSTTVAEKSIKINKFQKVDISSTKFTIGIKYYLNQNPLVQQ